MKSIIRMPFSFRKKIVFRNEIAEENDILERLFVNTILSSIFDVEHWACILGVRIYLKITNYFWKSASYIFKENFKILIFRYVVKNCHTTCEVIQMRIKLGYEVTNFWLEGTVRTFPWRVS